MLRALQPGTIGRTPLSVYVSRGQPARDVNGQGFGRRGAVTTWLVLTATVVLLPAMYFALDTQRQMTARDEYQSAADAAARAAARTLVDDFLLKLDATAAKTELASQLSLAAGDAGRLAAC